MTTISSGVCATLTALFDRSYPDRSYPDRFYLVTNLSDGHTLCVRARGAEEAVTVLGGEDYDTCMGEAFCTVRGDMTVLTLLNLSEYQQWILTGAVS